MTRTGSDYLTSLNDGRQVYLDGQLVEDVVQHPAFGKTIKTIARLYDFQAAAENRELMTFQSPTSGDYVNRSWQLPHSYAELVERRKALTAWAECSLGFLGRSPDHVASSLSGMYMGIEVFRRHGKERAEALSDYFTYARDNDLFVTYVIANPRADRTKDLADQDEEYLVAAICDEDAEGITIKGAKMLGTSAIIADELLVASIQPPRPGEEKYAFSAAIPMGAKGLKILSRKSYEGAAVSEFDNPLSSQLDENDAIIYFDEVKVPWERVFVHRDPEMCRAQFHDTPAHVMQNYQAQIRLMVKVRFMLGLARRITEVTGTGALPQVAEKLGHLAAQAAQVEGMVKGMEASGSQWGEYFIPDKRLMYAAQVLSQQLYPEMVSAVRDLGGASLLMLPSSALDFSNPEIADYIDLTQRSPAVDPTERVKLFKLAWDAVGSEFGSRQSQFEMFYAGAPYVTRAHAYRTYDWDTATSLVDDFMATYESPKS